MPGKKKATRNSGSTKNSPKDNFTNLSSLTDSSQIVASLFGNNSTLNVSGRKSEGKRKSLPYMTDSQDTNVDEDYETEATDVEEIKEIEKARAVKATLEQTKKAEKFEKKVKSTNLMIQKLSHEELELHYSKCIDMSSKNKINVKNAFKLQLIDFMKLMMDRKTEKSENLTLMSCTLDASAKIYSCRVDNVYSNILKMVKTCHNENKTKNDKKDDNDSNKGSCDEGSDDEDGLSKKKKEKKKYKASKTERLQFIKDPESLNRKEVKMCYYRQNLPRNQTYFLESSVLDDGHMLAPNRPIFVKNTNGPPNLSTFAIGSVWEGGVGNDNLEEKIPGYRDLRSKMFIADDGPENETIINQENAFTYDPSIESIVEIKNFNDISDGQSDCGDNDAGGDMEVDYDDYDMDQPRDDVEENVELSVSHGSEQPANASERLSVPDMNGSKPQVSFTPIAMSRMLRSSAAKPSDYSFFDDSKLAFMPSATHWKIKPSKRVSEGVGKTPSHTVRRGKTQYLDFFSEDQIKLSIDGIQEDNSLSYKLSIKTTKDWFHKKNELIFKPIIPNIRKNLLSLFKDQGICILNVKVPFVNNERECDINESVLLNPLDFTTPDADDDFDDDNNGGDYHPLEDWSEKMDPDPVTNLSKSNMEEQSTEDQEKPKDSEIPEEGGDHDMSIVPLPLKVEKVTVKYAKVQKRIDIKKLKGNIWNLMDLENKGSENKENEKKNKNMKNSVEEEKCVHFSKVFERMPDVISKEAAAELSFPLAFMAILHMANEKNLRLVGDEAHKDFTVSLDFPPK